MRHTPSHSEILECLTHSTIISNVKQWQQMRALNVGKELLSEKLLKTCCSYGSAFPSDLSRFVNIPYQTTHLYKTIT